MIREAEVTDLEQLILCAEMLWLKHSREELAHLLRKSLEKTSETIYPYLLENQLIGFIQVSLRFEYVEGTKSSPVAYIEGLYVKPDYRGQGISKRLLSYCEDWAVKKGCKELASDCDSGNLDVFDVHLSLDFEEINRIICFKKEL